MLPLLIYYLFAVHYRAAAHVSIEFILLVRYVAQSLGLLLRTRHVLATLVSATHVHAPSRKSRNDQGQANVHGRCTNAIPPTSA